MASRNMTMAMIIIGTMVVLACMDAGEAATDLTSDPNWIHGELIFRCVMGCVKNKRGNKRGSGNLDEITTKCESECNASIKKPIG